MGVTQKEMGKKLKYTFISSSSSIVLSHFSCAVMESAGVVGGWAGVYLHHSCTGPSLHAGEASRNIAAISFLVWFKSIFLSLSLSLSILQL